MKIYILLISISFLFSQQVGFKHLKKKWDSAGPGGQIEFRKEINQMIGSLDNSKNKFDILKLNFWIIRSLYSEGNIKEAINHKKSIIN